MNLALSQQTNLFLKDLRKNIGHEEIFVHPFMPEMYFEMNKINPYDTGVVETILVEKYRRANLNKLIEIKPQYVITNYKITEIFHYQFNAIDEYIFKHYTKIKSYANSTDLWKLNTDSLGG